MLIQWVLDWFAATIAPLLEGSVPDGLGTVLTIVHDGSVWLQSILSPLGVLVPFSTLTAMLVFVAGLWAWWATVALVRLVLWLVGR